MRKLILVALLLVAVLLVSWWAKGANFSLLSMMQNIAHPQTATSPAIPNGITPTLTPIPIEILITLTPNGFVPDVIMVSPNTKITWVNKTPFTGNISSNPQSANAQLNLGDFGQNASLSLIFQKSGRYNYYNNKNPQQRGTIVVKQ